VLDELHKSVLKIRMVPVEQLFRRFPARWCATLPNIAGKKDVALELAGENTDLDKGILDALAEPMTHILFATASITGIESSEDRIGRRQGGGGAGTISLNAFSTRALRWSLRFATTGMASISISISQASRSKRPHQSGKKAAKLPDSGSHQSYFSNPASALLPRLPRFSGTRPWAMDVGSNRARSF